MIGGLGAVFLSDPTAILLVAFAGMVNGQGRDRGAALVLDQAILPATTSDAERTRTFTWYNVLQDIGHALGCGLVDGLWRAARTDGVQAGTRFVCHLIHRPGPALRPPKSAHRADSNSGHEDRLRRPTLGRIPQNPATRGIKIIFK